MKDVPTELIEDDQLVPPGEISPDDLSNGTQVESQSRVSPEVEVRLTPPEHAHDDYDDETMLPRDWGADQFEALFYT